MKKTIFVLIIFVVIVSYFRIGNRLDDQDEHGHKMAMSNGLRRDQISVEQSAVNRGNLARARGRSPALERESLDYLELGQNEMIDSFLDEVEYSRLTQEMEKAIVDVMKVGQRHSEKEIESISLKILNYPIDQKMKAVLKNFSKEDLRYLLKQARYPAVKKINKIFEKNTAALAELNSTTAYKSKDDEKNELFNEINETSKSVESALEYGRAVSIPIFMALAKYHDKAANHAELKDRSAKMYDSNQKLRRSIIENSLNWSYDQLPKEELVGYARFLQQADDSKVNDLYLEESQKVFKELGTYIGKVLVELIEAGEEDQS